MNEEYKKLVGILIPYSIFCAFLSLYYYWSPFGIQPFEFITITITEALTYSVPFLVFTAFMLLPVLLIELVKPSNYPKQVTVTADESNFRFLIGLTIFLNLVIILLAELDGLSFSSILMRSVLIGLLCGLHPGAIHLGYTENFIKEFPTRYLRMFFVLILCCLPAASIAYALFSRSAVIDKTDYRYILTTDLVNGFDSEKLKYLGRLGEYVFLSRESEKRAIVFRQSDFSKLELIHESKE